MFGLNIHLQSFHLNYNLIGPSDKVRVSITTIPEDSKQAFIIEGKKMNNVHHFFTINISKRTERIIFVFRKKSFFQNDPIIASTIIHSNEFPKSKDDTTNTQLKNLAIYEPLSKLHDRKDQFKSANRKIVGQMEIQFSLEDAFPIANYDTQYQTSKSLNGQKNSKITHSINNENQIQNNDIVFIDNGY